MASREYVWTDEGVSMARRHGVDLAEVAQALYAPQGMRYERRIGDLLLVVMGMADTGRVIAVLCDRIGAPRHTRSSVSGSCRVRTPTSGGGECCERPRLRLDDEG